jgi:hypothetical protein
MCLVPTFNEAIKRVVLRQRPVHYSRLTEATQIRVGIFDETL